MRIGIVCPYHLNIPGGVQDHVEHQKAELERRGHEVFIITPLPRENGDLEYRDDVILLGQSRRVRTPQHTSADISISVDTDKIDEMLEKYTFDIIHFHEPLTPILARQLLGRTECPVVGTFHAAVMTDSLLGKSIAGSIGLYVKSILKHLDAITAVSPAATGYINEYISDEHVIFVPNGIDPHRFTFRETDPITSAPHIVYIGRLEKRKGVTYLIGAFVQLLKTVPNATLSIAGDGPERNRLEDQADELGLENNVHFLGFVSLDEKKKLLEDADLFVSPAIYGESFGIVLLEAMASGVPVIAGNNPGYSHVLQDWGSLGIVDPKDSILFASRMQFFLQEAQLRSQWRSWAKKRLVDFTYDKIVDSYESIYKQLSS